MTDIAAKAGVSASTVSFVLNERHNEVRISEKTRQKVLQAANEMGYRVNHQARAMRTSNTRTVGIVGGDLCIEHVGCMVSGILEEMDRQDYTLKILPAQDDIGQRQMIRRASELRLMGVIGLHLSPLMVAEFTVEAKRCAYPLVLLDTYDMVAELTQVVSDDASGIAAVIDHLFELGHRRIAMISSTPDLTLTVLREAAFRHEMARHYLPIPADFVAHGDFDMLAPSANAAKSLLQLPREERPTALFCTGDRIALASMQVAREMNIAVPEELSVIGFSDAAIAAFAAPALTTVRQPFREMGRIAARRLLQASADDNLVPSDEELISNRDGNFEMLPTRLIARHTTGPAPSSG